MLAPSSDELIETPDRPERLDRLSRPLLLTVGNFNDPVLDGIVPPVLWLERNYVLVAVTHVPRRHWNRWTVIACGGAAPGSWC